MGNNCASVSNCLINCAIFNLYYTALNSYQYHFTSSDDCVAFHCTEPSFHYHSSPVTADDIIIFFLYSAILNDGAL